MKKIQLVVLGLIKRDNKYLLTRRKEVDKDDKNFYGCWQIPGGGIEFGETPEQAIVREMKEELNVEIIIKDILPKLFTVIRNKWQGILACCLCEFADSNAKILLNEEASEYQWLSLDELNNLPRLPLTSEIVTLAEEN